MTAKTREVHKLLMFDTCPANVRDQVVGIVFALERELTETSKDLRGVRKGRDVVVSMLPEHEEAPS
jgi:hypothetical protein